MNMWISVCARSLKRRKCAPPKSVQQSTHQRSHRGSDSFAVPSRVQWTKRERWTFSDLIFPLMRRSIFISRLLRAFFPLEILSSVSEAMPECVCTDGKRHGRPRSFPLDVGGCESLRFHYYDFIGAGWILEWIYSKIGFQLCAVGWIGRLIPFSRVKR